MTTKENYMNRDPKNFRSIRYLQGGFSLIELMIATLVLAVGLAGAMLLVITSVAGDNRSKMDSTATVLSQMTMEMIASVSASSSGTVTITDCNPSGGSASHTINTAGSGGGSGATLTSGGAIDFTAGTVSGYSMSFYTCQASTSDRQALYDVRWNVKTLSPSAKLVTVGARVSTADTNQATRFAVPVTLQMIVGLS
jgi:prepilin-type N-terminal cleavage/methylation domain-containing protein